MAQRGIQSKDAELIASIGSEVEDGFVVLEKDYQQVERMVKTFLARCRRVVGKRLVVADGNIVTTYHVSQSQIRRVLRRSRPSRPKLLND